MNSNTEIDDDVLQEVYDLAFEYEKANGHCSQPPIAAICNTFGLVDNSVFTAAQSLAGGGALCGDGTCGALQGGMLIIGSIYGRPHDKFTEGHMSDWMRSAKVSKRLTERFRDEFGSVLCSEVQQKKFGRSFNLWDPAEFETFEEMGGHENKCPDVTGTAARLTAEILFEEGISPE